MADKSADQFRGQPKGREYCDTPGTACWYNSDDTCVNCGRRKGWRNESGTSFQTQLGILADYIKFAQEAIVDESEGNFKYYVTEIEARAKNLATQVQAM
jgi:hypothetical protein